MYWSGFDAESNVQMVRKAGIPVPFLWIVAQK
jgi:hypothetical protein